MRENHIFLYEEQKRKEVLFMKATKIFKAAGKALLGSVFTIGVGVIGYTIDNAKAAGKMGIAVYEGISKCVKTAIKEAREPEVAEEKTELDEEEVVDNLVEDKPEVDAF